MRICAYDSDLYRYKYLEFGKKKGFDMPCMFSTPRVQPESTENHGHGGYDKLVVKVFIRPVL